MAIELPTVRSKKTEDIGAMSMLLYGSPKIGKSTIAASFPDALFVVTEEGHKSMEIFKVGVTEWPDFRDLCKKLRKEEHKFKTVVIDTIDLLFSVCETYICKQKGIDHPSELEYGRGWGFLRDEFQKALAQLAAPDKAGKIPFGLVFLSHAKEVEVKGRMVKTTRTVCTLSGTARKVVLPLVDIVGYCGFGEDAAGEPTRERTVTFAPTELIEAGDRTGRLPENVLMRKTGWYELLQDVYTDGGRESSKPAKKESGGLRPKRKSM